MIGDARAARAACQHRNGGDRDHADSLPSAHGWPAHPAAATWIAASA
jgi:hypothetical protein